MEKGVLTIAHSVNDPCDDQVLATIAVVDDVFPNREPSCARRDLIAAGSGFGLSNEKREHPRDGPERFYGDLKAAGARQN